jgi:hypothetical protein
LSEQKENLDRVASRINGAVLLFCQLNLADQMGLFYMEDLRLYINRSCGLEVAPDSPGRILRNLRQRGLVEYRVLSRKDSLYELEWVSDK